MKMINKFLGFFRKKDLINDDCDCKHLLYDYVLWYNSYEGIWYAINRSHLTAFFTGGKDRDDIQSINGYVSNKDLTSLIQSIIDLYDTER